jgi:hypothetical protein
MELRYSEYETALMNEWITSVETFKAGKKTTVCLMTVKNGFEIVGSAACVRQEDFQAEIGDFFAIKDALRKLDEVVGFYRQCQVH